MYAIVYKSDGFPICRQVAGVSPDPVVTWNTEAAAMAFISAKGGGKEFQPVALTDEAGNITAVQKFDKLEDAREFAAEVGRWQARHQQIQNGNVVMTTTKF